MSMPPVEELLCRTACCCQYCGCTCNPEYKPFGLGNQCTSLCMQDACGCAMATGDVSKRACNATKCTQRYKSKYHYQ